MAATRFDDTKLDALSPEYKARYLEAASTAVKEYLTWMDQNAKGIRFFKRRIHLYHGSSGRERARVLQKALASAVSFSQKIDAVSSAIADSGFCNHSLKRYVYMKFAHESGINFQGPVSDEQFQRKVADAAREELMGLKSKEAEFNLENMSFWCLTDVAQKRNRYHQKNYEGAREDSSWDNWSSLLLAVESAQLEHRHQGNDYDSHHPHDHHHHDNNDNSGYDHHHHHGGGDW